MERNNENHEPIKPKQRPAKIINALQFHSKLLAPSGSSSCTNGQGMRVSVM
jgi:hypothetical protein